MEWISENAWMLWLLLALVLAGVEMLSFDLIFIMLGGGAVAALLSSLLGAPGYVQGIVFALVSLAMIFFVRPIAVRHMKKAVGDSRTNVDRLIGSTAVVVEAVAGSAGLVKIEGEVWTARAERGEFLPGDTVQVVAIEGATAVIEPHGPTSPYRAP